MRSIHSFALSALLLGALSAGAQAGQIFSFQNPVKGSSFGNAMFETQQLFSDLSSTSASFENIYTSNPTKNFVTLSTYTFDTNANLLSVSTKKAYFFLTNESDPTTNSEFDGDRNVNATAYRTGPGTLSFYDSATPSDPTAPLLRITFSESNLSPGNFAAGGLITFSGSLLDLQPGDFGNENGSFSWANRITTDGDPDNPLAHHTGTFSSSIGKVDFQAVPEPSSCAALALGALALLRRKRRA